MTDAPDADCGALSRRAQPAEAVVLASLALTSKAVWGYDVGFMAACRAELTITPESISRRPTHVIERQGQALGFYQLRIGAVTEVAQFFIAPAMLRRGLGRRLFAHLESTARAAAATRLEVDSDPHAEAFYLAMGMRRVGAAPSGSIPGRMLPRLAKEIGQDAGIHMRFPSGQPRDDESDPARHHCAVGWHDCASLRCPDHQTFWHCS